MLQSTSVLTDFRMALLEWVAAVPIISKDSGEKKNYMNITKCSPGVLSETEMAPLSTHFLHLVGRGHPEAASSDSL